MNVSLYQAAAAMNASSRWQEVISQNLTSSSIPGFKTQDISFAAVQAGVAPGSVSPPGSTYVIPRADRGTNFTPGEVTATNDDTDFAIQGPGFFEVQLPDGSPAYTRNGHFSLSLRGVLVGSQGCPVMGERGPIQLDPNNRAPMRVDAGGNVRQGADIKDKIKLVDFNDIRLLTPINASCFQADNLALEQRPADGASIQQGYLENANTSSALEMGSLITAMRMFEVNQRVMTLQDERTSRAISDLSGTS
jgi:flagellar basal-body rod protein FlgF